MSLRALRELERLRAEFGADAAPRKLEFVRDLARATLSSARAVERWHECLCFLRAHPDDERVRARVAAELERFDRRRDLRRHRDALANSGIAGTEIRFRFYQPTAAWLVERFPGALDVDWDEFDGAERLEALLPLLLTWSEAQAPDESEGDLRARIDALLGRGETDAHFLA